MSFNGTEGSFVTLREASSWTSSYRATISSGEIIAHFFGTEKIKALLDQENCVGIRIYYGIDENGKKNLILVGAKANEDDLVDGLILERAFTCPPKCSASNVLNS
ncbi:MAG: hypothetical protein RI922_1476 [Bacteroidota bacterium]|jgi:hypothetical protein